jgi:hypothetical protein
MTMKRLTIIAAVAGLAAAINFVALSYGGCDAGVVRPTSVAVFMVALFLGVLWYGECGPEPVTKPPRKVTDAFWRTFGGRIPDGAVVLASTTEINPKSVQTVLKNQGFGDTKTSAYLFFVDLEPEANWSHPCMYVFMPVTGEPTWYTAGWPPDDTIVLKPQARPRA